MKRFTYLLPAIIFFASCSNESSNKPDPAETVDTVESSAPIVSEPPYNVEYDSVANVLRLKRRTDVGSATAGEMINLINDKYPGIKLDLVKAGTDTIELRIDDATKLSQQMGSAGAEAYLAELTYSLTEVEGIKAISIDFEEGDHAMPGVYTRNDFKNLVGK